MLIHVTRIALRNTVRSASGPQWDELKARYQGSAESAGRIVDVCLGIHAPAAAGLALAFQAANPTGTPRAGEAVAYIANTIDVSRLPEVDRLRWRIGTRIGNSSEPY